LRRSPPRGRRGKGVRIGYLATDLAAASSTTEAFRRGLRDLGYVEGRNVVIEYRDAEGKSERLPALAAELATLKADVIVTAGGTLAALAAKRATKTVPIVFIAVSDPVASAVVTSLASLPTCPSSNPPSSSWSSISRPPRRWA
jgi:putative tryptophan/tyrosine transport system substrate-binding protein